MQSSERFALLAYNSLAALAGAVGMFLVVRSAMLDDAQPLKHPPQQISAADIARQSDRLVFVPPGSLGQPELPYHELPYPEPPTLTRPDATPHPQLMPSIPPESTGSRSWSTEVQPETPPPQQAERHFTVLPSLNLRWPSAKQPTLRRTYTLKTRVAELAPAANIRLAAKFEAAKAVWPPAEIAFVAIKDEKALELHARSAGGAWTLIHRYRVLAASGSAGPKLRQGDRQVPEGIYGIASLNPNSAYHVSLAVNYPNAFDRQMAVKDGRKELGGDIMIHGKNLSAGCLAMGDEAVEELFVLAAQIGLSNVRLIIAPTDFRQGGLPSPDPSRPDWLPRLYTEIATAMANYKAPPRSSGLLSFFTR